MNRLIQLNFIRSSKLSVTTLYCLLLICFFSGCSTLTKQNISRDVDDIHLRVSLMPAGLERFGKNGPFDVTTKKNVPLTLSAGVFQEVDIYQTSAKGKVPIVVISHGNFSGKRAHAYQASRLASWGFNVLVVELPNRDQWIENGRRIFEVSTFLYKWPQFLGENSDGARIVLVGHSFGGSAVTLAASQGAPISGVILLDPAVVHPTVSYSMAKVIVPGVLLGADTNIFSARKRSEFRKNWLGEFLEFSIVGATHDDAQGPSMFSNFALGFDPFTSSVRREIFVSSIVASAISISSYGTLELLSKDLIVEKRVGKIVGLRSNRKRY